MIVSNSNVPSRDLPILRGVDDTGPYTTAYLTHIAGLTHDPDNVELKDGARRALDELKKTPMSDEAEDVLGRAMSDPQLHAIMVRLYRLTHFESAWNYALETEI